MFNAIMSRMKKASAVSFGRCWKWRTLDAITPFVFWLDISLHLMTNALWFHFEWRSPISPWSCWGRKTSLFRWRIRSSGAVVSWRFCITWRRGRWFLRRLQSVSSSEEPRNFTIRSLHRNTKLIWMTGERCWCFCVNNGIELTNSQLVPALSFFFETGP